MEFAIKNSRKYLKKSTSSNQTPESQITLPADSQSSICSVKLYEEVNVILTRNKFSLSPFKLPSSVDVTSLPNNVNRKHKQLLDTFYKETDCKIRKLYDVSGQKLEFHKCKICDEWNEILSLVLENENLTFIEKVRLMTVAPGSLIAIEKIYSL